MAALNLDRRKGVSDFLSKKGYKFSEDLDLGQLDKQFRQPLTLAATRAPPQRKKKKKHESRDIFSLVDEDEHGDAAAREGEIAARIHKTQAEIEQEREREEAKRKEAMEWGSNFQVFRSDLNRHDNNILRETFVTDTKSIYQEVDSIARKHKAVLDSVGVFDSSVNQLRAESQKRVTLAKKLRLDELKKKSESQVEMRIELQRQGQMDALEHALRALKEQDGQRRSHLPAEYSNAGGAQSARGPRNSVAAMRQRQREAESKYKLRQASAQAQSSGLPSLTGELSAVSGLDDARDEGKLEDRRRRRAAREAQKLQTTVQMFERVASSHPLDGVKDAKDDAYANAPTPPEMHEVDDAFIGRRREIRMRNKESNEQARQQHRDNEKEYAAAKVNRERKQREASAEPSQSVSFAADHHHHRTTTPGRTANRDEPPPGHLRLPPQLRAPVFAPLSVSVGDPLIGHSASSHQPEKRDARAVAVEQAGGLGRTRYLQTHHLAGQPESDVLDEYPPSALPPAAGKLGVSKGQSLNPSFAAVPGPKENLLQAAESKLTPRLGRITAEEDLRPVDESFYHPDAALLRKGTPELEERLGQEYSKASTQLHMPNFLGEADLLHMVPERSSDNAFLLGPAPSDGSKRRALMQSKKRKPRPPSQGGEDSLEGMAAALAAEHSAMLSADTNVPKEDLGIVPGEPPTVIDDRLAMQLEEVWEALEVPLLEKLGMVVKYSQLQHAAMLHHALDAWREAVAAVTEREELLQSLGRKISVQWHKAEEDAEAAEAVATFKGLLQHATDKCAAAAELLLNRFGDVLTYRGMPYVEELHVPVETSLERVMGKAVRVPAPPRPAQSFLA